MDLELDYVHAVCRDEFARVFRDAFQELTPSERNVLRLHSLDELTLEGTAAACHAGRATVARWLARARDKLLVEIRRFLVERLRLSETDLVSVLRYVQGQFDLSIRPLVCELTRPKHHKKIKTVVGRAVSPP